MSLSPSWYHCKRDRRAIDQINCLLARAIWQIFRNKAQSWMRCSMVSSYPCVQGGEHQYKFYQIVGSFDCSSNAAISCKYVNEWIRFIPIPHKLPKGKINQRFDSSDFDFKHLFLWYSQIATLKKISKYWWKSRVWYSIQPRQARWPHGTKLNDSNWLRSRNKINCSTVIRIFIKLRCF